MKPISLVVRSRRQLLGATAATMVAPWLAGCGRRGPSGRAVAAGATVLALGDSLTFGTGASPSTAYPAVLAGLTGWQVVNAGVPGDTSADGLARLPDLLAEHAPALLLVSLGGNDFLRAQPEAQTRDNLRRVCELGLAAGAQVVLIAVPRASALAAATGSLSDHGLYEDLAGELKLPLFAKGWAEVLGDASLRADPVHANAQGYARFTQALFDWLKARGFVG